MNEKLILPREIRRGCAMDDVEVVVGDVEGKKFVVGYDEKWGEG